MSRPKPNVLLEHIDKVSYKVDQILEADEFAIWAVFYKNVAFNLKSFNSLTSHPGPKYKKTCFSNKGHAFNLARKLNAEFNCDDFKVVKLISGIVVG